MITSARPALFECRQSYDATQPTKRERHEAARIDYIIVD
jgi:hypothetical protein